MATGEPGLAVLRDIWHARSQTSAELDELYGHRHGKTCKNMKNVGFNGMSDNSAGGDNAPVDGELRAAWRERLAREGKLRPDGEGVGRLLLGPSDDER